MNQRNYLEQYKRLLRMGCTLVLLPVETAVFAWSWYGYFNWEIRKPFQHLGNYLMIIVYLALLLVFLVAFGGLKIGFWKKSGLILSQILSILSMHTVVLVQILLMSGKVDRLGAITKVIIFITGIDIILSVALIFIFDYIYYKIFPPRKMLLVYQDRPPQPLMQKMYARRDKFEIAKQVNISEGREKIEAMIGEHDSVVLCDIHAKERNHLLKYCYGRGIRVYSTPKLSDIIVKNSEIIHLFDTPLILSRNQGLSFEDKVVKRAMDILISGILLVVTSPLMALTALAVKVYDGGPAIFSQIRVTQGGREFEVYKFRSMIVDAEKAGVALLATENDSRITPVGKFIRATRLDELPQLYNVLMGDMSLVGPRPERPEIIKKYEKTMPEFAYRLKIKGGLTGYAQVYGKYNTTPYDKLKMDLMYIENYSILQDLKILFLTVKVIFMKDSTEGISQEQLARLLGDKQTKEQSKEKE